jgi:hypothetical protein
LIIASLAVVVLFGVVLITLGPGKTTAATTTTVANTPVAQWNSRYGTIPLALSVDLTALAAIQFGKPINPDCAQLQYDVQNGQKAPAVPKTSLEQSWSGLLGALNNLVTACAGVVQDPSNQTNFAALRSQSQTLISPVDRIITALHA